MTRLLPTDYVLINGGTFDVPVLLLFGFVSVPSAYRPGIRFLYSLCETATTVYFSTGTARHYIADVWSFFELSFSVSAHSRTPGEPATV